MSGAPSLRTVQVGDRLPTRELRIDTIELFLYNAALWNAHKIHFDHPYATQVEGHPGVVIAGPQLGDYLTQAAVEWMGESGELLSVEYTNRKLSYVGEVLRSVGKVAAVDQAKAEVVLDLAILNEANEVTTPGTAVVRIARG